MLILRVFLCLRARVCPRVRAPACGFTASQISLNARCCKAAAQCNLTLTLWLQHNVGVMSPHIVTQQKKMPTFCLRICYRTSIMWMLNTFTGDIIMIIRSREYYAGCCAFFKSVHLQYFWIFSGCVCVCVWIVTLLFLYFFLSCFAEDLGLLRLQMLPV